MSGRGLTAPAAKRLSPEMRAAVDRYLAEGGTVRVIQPGETADLDQQARRILKVLNEVGAAGLSINALARRCGLGPGFVKNQLARLRVNGLANRKMNAAIWYVSGRGREALREAAGSFRQQSDEGLGRRNAEARRERLRAVLQGAPDVWHTLKALSDQLDAGAETLRSDCRRIKASGAPIEFKRGFGVRWGARR